MTKSACPCRYHVVVRETQNGYKLDEFDIRMLQEAQPRFPPPYAELAADPETFGFQWARMAFAFGLPDPAQFPVLPVDLSDRDAESVDRYIQVCQELAGYSLINSTGGLSINVVEGQVEEFTVDGPPKEALRGFAVLFRQLHSDDDEPASYKVAKAILEKASHKAADDYVVERIDQSKKWNSARGKLLQYTLSDIARTKLFTVQGAPSDYSDLNRQHSPATLISMFNYGEYIHWGRRRQDHRSAFENPIYGALLEFQFHESLIGLSHFYLGFAKVLESAAAR